MSIILKCIRRTAALLLVMAAILSLAACGSKEKADAGNSVQMNPTTEAGVQTDQAADISVQDDPAAENISEQAEDTEQTTEEVKVLKNVLPANYFVTLFDGVESPKYSTFLGVIRTITFYSSTDNAPSDAVSLNDAGSVIGWYSECSSEYDWEKGKGALSNNILHDEDHLYDVFIAADGGVMIDNGFMFFSGNHLREINFNDSFDTSFVMSMEGMFRGSAITELDLSCFDTSNVTNMADMFAACPNMEYLDLSSFDTSNVKYMGGMFANLGSVNDEHRLEYFNISGFNTANVKDMNQMFSNCHVKSLDLSHFDTSKVEQMYEMFKNCTAESITGLEIPDGCDIHDMYKGTILE